MGGSKPVMSNDFEMVELVWATHVAQAIFFRIILNFFRRIACGFSNPNQYFKVVDANGRPMWFFSRLDFVALKAEE